MLLHIKHYINLKLVNLEQKTELQAQKEPCESSFIIWQKIRCVWKCALSHIEHCVHSDGTAPVFAMMAADGCNMATEPCPSHVKAAMSLFVPVYHTYHTFFPYIRVWNSACTIVHQLHLLLCILYFFSSNSCYFLAVFMC